MHILVKPETKNFKNIIINITLQYNIRKSTIKKFDDMIVRILQLQDINKCLRYK